MVFYFIICLNLHLDVLILQLGVLILQLDVLMSLFYNWILMNVSTETSLNEIRGSFK